ncbi:MAG: hypothetical protein ACREKM_05580 [Longimicrobiales bacterium]
MSARAAVLAVALVLAGSACAAQTPVRGRVVVSSMGPQPLTTLQVDSGGPLVLEGPLAAELRTLNGASIEVQGARTSTPPNGGIDVERYVILEIAGEAPFVGRLDASGTQLTLEDGMTLRLEGLPEPIRTGGAARIWVTGERRGPAIEVRAAGVISR